MLTKIKSCISKLWVKAKPHAKCIELLPFSLRTSNPSSLLLPFIMTHSSLSLRLILGDKHHRKSRVEGSSHEPILWWRTRRSPPHRDKTATRSSQSQTIPSWTSSRCPRDTTLKKSRTSASTASSRRSADLRRRIELGFLEYLRASPLFTRHLV
jgi:hypothetical protein